MRIKMDGHLVEPLDPDVDAKSQKKNKKKQTGSEEPSRKSPRFESDPKDDNDGNLPSAVETSRKGKEKVIATSHLVDVDADVDIAAEDRRTLKIGTKASRLEMDPPLSTPTRQTSDRGSNHIPAGGGEGLFVEGGVWVVGHQSDGRWIPHHTTEIQGRHALDPSTPVSPERI
ncbi:hypothetical protein R1flu_013735 [Riccia fluitans]|uniref:Uncharacterized protein n=1 Tax=Riccia fluitans TaxID=41844 RepID=A0ABD1YHL3_9MARC